MMITNEFTYTITNIKHQNFFFQARRYLQMRDLKQLKESGATYEELKEALNNTIPAISTNPNIKVCKM